MPPKPLVPDPGAQHSQYVADGTKPALGGHQCHFTLVNSAPALWYDIGACIGPGNTGSAVNASVPTMGLAPTQKPEAWTDEDLVEECLRGNQEAWCRVVEKYKTLVYSAPMRYRMEPQDAADIFQEVWVDLYAELSKLRRPGALGAWLVSVAYHKCYQWKRRRAREAEPQGSGPIVEAVSQEPLFPEWKEQAERSQILRDAVAGLPERCQRMVDLLFFHDPPLPYAEVARTLGLAEGSIGFIRGRCLLKLREGLVQRGF